MARREKISANDYYVEHEDDYWGGEGDDGYYDEYDEEQAMREAKKQSKKEKKQLEKERKKARGIQDADIDQVEAQIPGVFTRE